MESSSENGFSHIFLYILNIQHFSKRLKESRWWLCVCDVNCRVKTQTKKFKINLTASLKQDLHWVKSTTQIESMPCYRNSTFMKWKWKNFEKSKLPISECICSLSTCLHSICIPRGGEIALHIMHFSTQMKRNFTKPKRNRKYWKTEPKNHLRSQEAYKA